jgi:pyruvate, water dikinase
VDDEGEVFLLQSRPETVWADKDRTARAAPAPRPFDHVFNLLGGKRPSEG